MKNKVKYLELIKVTFYFQINFFIKKFYANPILHELC